MNALLESLAIHPQLLQHLRFSHAPSCEDIADNTNLDSDSHGA